MKQILFIFCIGIFIISCNNDPKVPVKSTIETTNPPTPAKPNPAQRTIVDGKELYPSVPVDIVQSLWDNCDYVDFSFHNLPLTMSQQELKDIRHSLAQISNQPAKVNDICKEVGRMLFYQNAEIALEGGIHYSQGCSYFVFWENGQPKYANYMTPNGINFYNNVFSNLNKQ